jgi:hypothetical protein
MPLQARLVVGMGLFLLSFCEVIDTVSAESPRIEVKLQLPNLY